MRAVDTNVVVRYLASDDPQQSRRARAVFAAGDLFVATTVLLEVEWVLRRSYSFKPKDVIAALTSLAGLPGVRLAEPERTRLALNWTGAGLDFADAMHLAGADGCTAFVSFDRALARNATEVGALPVVEP